METSLWTSRHGSPAHCRRLCLVSHYHDQRRCARCPTFCYTSCTSAAGFTVTLRWGAAHRWCIMDTAAAADYGDDILMYCVWSPWRTAVTACCWECIGASSTHVLRGVLRLNRAAPFCVKLHLRHKRTNERTNERTKRLTDSYQESNLVYVSLKMWHLVAIF